MHRTILILTLALVASTTEVRADLIAYNMFGTITSATGSSSFAEGDKVAWTLQYDPSINRMSGGISAAGAWSNYQMPNMTVLTNITDQTTGYHFSLLLPSSDKWSGNISLTNGNPSPYQNYPSGDIFAYQNGAGNGVAISASLKLRVYGTLPTLNLAEFQLKGLTVTKNPEYSNFSYYNTPYHGTIFGFTASVDSIAGVVMAPEPGSLTLFLLGIAGLAARGIRQRFRL